MQNLQTLISAMEDADYVEILSKDENFQELKNKKSIQDILDDIELEKVIKDNQYLRFFANSKIQALTKDNDTMRLLMSLDIDKIVIKNI
jgi:3-methyladenine DNA glycosylase AlkC